MPVRGIDEIRRARDIASTDDGKLLTNFYVGDESVSGWIERGQIFISGGDRTFLLLRNRKDFCHLYFASRSSGIRAIHFVDADASIEHARAGSDRRR